MTKNRLTLVEAWLRVVWLAVLGGVGFVLLFHGLDADEPMMAWYWSLLLRIAGAGMMYLAYRAGKALHEWGMLPEWLTQEDELEDAGRESEVSERSEVIGVIGERSLALTGTDAQSERPYKGLDEEIDNNN